jgi:RNA polymerase sigma-70 factor (ECF subfamily)
MADPVGEPSQRLLARWREGDQQAATELFARYSERLIALARSRLSAKLAQRVDPEDVVQSVCRIFFTEARDGRYDLQRGGDLWHLLAAITLHKLQSLVHYHTAQKRAPQRECGFATEDSLVRIQPTAFAANPTPLEAATFVDEVESILRRLDSRHRPIVVLRLSGKSIEEIAAELKYSERTVRRVLDHLKHELLQVVPTRSST